MITVDKNSRGITTGLLAIALMCAGACKKNTSTAEPSPTTAADPATQPAPKTTTAWPDLGQPGAPAGGGENDAALIVGLEGYDYVPAVPGAQGESPAPKPSDRKWAGWLSSRRGVGRMGSIRCGGRWRKAGWCSAGCRLAREMIVARCRQAHALAICLMQHDLAGLGGDEADAV